MVATVKKAQVDIQELIHGLPDIWYCLDADNRLIQINENLLSYFGFDANQVSGQDLGTIFSNQEAFESLHQKVRKVGAIHDEVMMVADTSGATRFISVSCRAGSNEEDNEGRVYGNIRDITEREKDLKAERESYLNFVDVVNSTLDGMLIIDKITQKVIDANPKALDILGYSMDEIKSIPLGLATMADEEEMADFLDFLEANKDLRIDRKVRHKNGSLIDLEISARMMHVGEGRLFQGVIRDITQKKRLFKLEKLKEDILGVKLKGLPSEGIIKLLCDRLEEIGTRSDICYLSYDENSEAIEVSINSKIPADIKALLAEHHSIQKRARSFFAKARHNLPISKFIQYLPKGKVEGWPYLSWCSFPVFINGDSLLGVMVVLSRSGNDIPQEDLKSIHQLISILGNVFQKIEQESQLIKSENRYRELVDHSPMAIGVYADEKIAFANQVLYDILQLDNTSEIGRDMLSDFVKENNPVRIQQMIRHLEEDGIIPIQELSLTRPNGQALTLMIQATKVIYQNYPAVQVVFYDITARKEMELEKETQNLYTKAMLELEALGSKASTKNELVDGYCNSLVDKIGFDCVWIADHKDGALDPYFPGNHDANQSCASLVDKHVQKFLSSEPYRKAVKSHKMIVSVADNDHLFEPWQKVMKEYNLRFFIVLPFIRDEKIRGTFCLLSKQLNAIDEALKSFLSQMIYECGYGIYAIELKQNRDELNDFNKLLVDSLDVVSVSFDLLEDKLSLSGNTQSLVGCDLEEFAEMVRDPESFIQSNDLKKLKRQLDKIKSNDGNFDVEFRVKSRDKTVSWINAIGKLYWEGQELNRVAGILINTDQRKQEEVNHVKAHITIRDQERVRIARELHDSLGQTLTIASMSLDAMSESVASLSEDRLQLYHDAYKMVNDAIDETRTISHNLMPSLLMDFGLVKSIRSDVQKLNNAGAIDFHFEYDEECNQRYAEEIELNFYNIVREGVKNIINHSKATKANIELRSSEDILSLVIKDNGKGWDKEKSPESDGLGMSSLEGRAISMGADFFISGENGFEIRVDLDLSE